MATVVIIHAAEDTLPARALAEKLRLAKLTVTLELPPGEPLREAVRGANAVVALWSPRSVEQSAIVDEVVAARSKGVIHARMQNAANPAQFRNDKSIDLTGWRGEEEFPAWRDLAKAVTSKAGVANLPPPAPRPPSGFFQPGMANPQAAAQAQRNAQQQQRSAPRSPPPPPRQPQQQRSEPPRRAAAPAASRDEPRKGSPMVMIAIITFLVVAVVGGGGYFYLNNMQAAKASSTAWENVDKTDASEIRAFIAGNPGAHRQEATQALSTLEEQTFEAAKDADSIEAFQGFLTDFPDSSHALEARGRIAELRAQPAPTTTIDTATTTDTTVNPDLLPPGATSTSTATTAPPAGGPVPLTPAPTTTTTP